MEQQEAAPSYSRSPGFRPCVILLSGWFAGSRAGLRGDRVQDDEGVAERRDVVGADVVGPLPGGEQFGGEAGGPDARDIAPGERAEEGLAGRRDQDRKP